MAKEFINPAEGLHAPIGNGYTHAVRAGNHIYVAVLAGRQLLESDQHAVRAGNHIYVAGQVALDADGNLVGENDPAAQAEQVFKNVVTALKGAGATVDDVVRITAYITRREDIPAIRDARAKYFPMQNPPAAALLLVAGLAHPGFLMEVEATAVLD